MEEGGGQGGRGGGRGHGVTPGTAQPPPINTNTNSHNAEPPPGGAKENDPPPNGRRSCAPPANGMGKPAGYPPGDWTEGQWKGAMIDFQALDRLAASAAGAATRLARPNDATMTQTRCGVPRSAGGFDTGQPAVWDDDACAYCHHRERAPPGTDPADDWWYGNGNGKHSPHRCQPFKRFLAEGGDLTKEPLWASHLRTCIRCPPPSNRA